MALRNMDEPIITEGSFIAFIAILAQLVRDIETLRLDGEYDHKLPVEKLQYLAKCAAHPVNQQQLSLEDMAYLGRTLGLFEHELKQPDGPLLDIDPPTDRPN